MKPTLNPFDVAETFQGLFKANLAFNEAYPGETTSRQPVHTVYGGAHLFKADTAAKMGIFALRHLGEHAENFALFAKAFQLPGHEQLPEQDDGIAALEAGLYAAPEAFHEQNRAAWLAYTVYTRVIEKLQKEPVEDFRIDFEDGYGNRPDAEEDDDARSTAEEMAKGMAESSLPPFIGIRIKPLTEELQSRAIRTLDIFLSTLIAETGGEMPGNFVITLPKVTIPEQVTALGALFEMLESRLALAPHSLKMEIMVETPQSIINNKGEIALPGLVAAGKGRIVAAHFGVYDYTAACNITAAHQSITHPACDFARHAMQVSLSGTGIWLSDGATNIMPMAPHRAEKDGRALSAKQLEENRRVVYAAWRLNFEHVTRSLQHGYYQGWDLHPTQLPIRYAAIYTFFLEGFEAATQRLKNFIEMAAQATLAGEVFDDAATGQALLNYFLRGMNCGAITEEEATATGLTLDEIRSRSFLKILQARRKKE
jgi:citrate lyase beta subunit